jgi:hypothetical protein
MLIGWIADFQLNHKSDKKKNGGDADSVNQIARNSDPCFLNNFLFHSSVYRMKVTGQDRDMVNETN